jgi:hypothetical protein
MLTSVHLVDGSVRSTIGALRHAPAPADVPGLRDARPLIAAPLGSLPPRPQLRHALVAFWDDEPSLDAFLATHEYARHVRDGWSVRLDPLRAVHVAAGPWPGVTPDVPGGIVLERDAPTAVLTIGHLRVNRAVPFFRASAVAEKEVLAAPGLVWATGLANVGQRVVATFSLWDSSRTARGYAKKTPGHVDAMRQQAASSFQHFGSFIRYRPRAAQGELAGRNPLAETITETLNGAAGV